MYILQKKNGYTKLLCEQIIICKFFIPLVKSSVKGMKLLHVFFHSAQPWLLGYRYRGVVVCRSYVTWRQKSAAHVSEPVVKLLALLAS